MVKIFTIQLTMTSDWHIGTGQGRGDIDSLVQRDQHQLPYIPAKTLTGILRDGCELVAAGLDDGQENGIWQQWVNCLFGEQPALAESPREMPPRPAALSIRAAHLPTSLRMALIAKPKLKEAIAFIKPGISIEPFSGCAKTDFLRFEEMVRQGAILESRECSLSLPPESSEAQEKTAYALLIAGAAIIERLGGKRRRGAGKCKITIEQESRSYLEWLQNHPTPPHPPEFAELLERKTDKYLHNQEPQWYSISLKITTKSPVIIAARTVGNVVETLDYIPGKYLLRSLHKKLGHWLNISQAISCGDVIVTNATPITQQQPSRPVPFCLFAEKINGGLDQGIGVYNRFVENEPAQVQLKGIREGYVGSISNGCLPPYQKVERHIYTHNTVEDEYQRPTSDVGGVYSYEAIAEGTEFCAELRLRKYLVQHLNKNDRQWYQSLMGEYCIGQSKKDDYGLIAIEEISPPQALTFNIPIQGLILTVWILSDVLIRDERLQPTTDLNIFRETLSTALGVTLREREDNDRISLMVRQRRTDSWQVRWGLSRPSLVGLQAGSCMVYEVSGDLDPNKLGQLQTTGIGERTVEGYGQLCFNDPLLTMPLSNLKPTAITNRNLATTRVNPLPPNHLMFNYAHLIEKAAWRKEISKRAIALAADKDKRKEILGIEILGEESKPTMTQLGALRSVIGRLQSSDDQTQITGWITNLESVPNRKEKWNEDSLSKIRQLISNRNEIWRILEIPEIPDDLTITHEVTQTLKDELWAEAVRNLIDNCIRAHKRDWEKASQMITR